MPTTLRKANGRYVLASHTGDVKMVRIASCPLQSDRISGYRHVREATGTSRRYCYCGAELRREPRAYGVVAWRPDGRYRAAEVVAWLPGKPTDDSLAADWAHAHIGATPGAGGWVVRSFGTADVAGISDSPVRCMGCDHELQPLDVFPGPRCLDCYRPIGEQLARGMTADRLAAMWGRGN